MEADRARLSRKSERNFRHGPDRHSPSRPPARARRGRNPEAAGGATPWRSERRRAGRAGRLQRHFRMSEGGRVVDRRAPTPRRGPLRQGPPEATSTSCALPPPRRRPTQAPLRPSNECVGRRRPRVPAGPQNCRCLERVLDRPPRSPWTGRGFPVEPFECGRRQRHHGARPSAAATCSTGLRSTWSGSKRGRLRLSTQASRRITRGEATCNNVPSATGP